MNKSELRSALSFARHMYMECLKTLAEWQKLAIENLNKYCACSIDVNEYCRFIKSYSGVYFKYEYWRSNKDHLLSELRGIKDESINSNKQN